MIEVSKVELGVVAQFWNSVLKRLRQEELIV
jgi:hypothetical protein